MFILCDGSTQTILVTSKLLEVELLMCPGWRQAQPKACTHFADVTQPMCRGPKHVVVQGRQPSCSNRSKQDKQPMVTSAADALAEQKCNATT